MCILWQKVPISFFCTWISSFLNIIHWRNYHFSIVYSWPPFPKSLDYIHMALFLSFSILFHQSIHLFYANIMLFWLLNLCNVFWSWKFDASSSGLLAQYCFGYWESLVVPYKFLASPSLFLWKKTSEILTGFHWICRLLWISWIF